MRTILLYLLFAKAPSQTSATVYICDNGNSKRYHLITTCRGLSNCSHRVIKRTLDEVKKEGKTLCHWENNSNK